MRQPIRNTPQDIGLRVRRSRELAHLRQDELASLCGVHQSTVARWERGRIAISLRHVENLSVLLRRSRRWLLEGPR